MTNCLQLFTGKYGNDGLSWLPCGFDPKFESGRALVNLVEYEMFGILLVSAVDVKNASRRDAVLLSVIVDVRKQGRLQHRGSEGHCPLPQPTAAAGARCALLITFIFSLRKPKNYLGWIYLSLV